MDRFSFWPPLCSTLCCWCLLSLAIAGPVLAAAEGRNTEKLRLAVGIPPQAFVVEAIAGNLVEVEILLPPGQSPATYEPTPKQMARLSECHVLFSVGLLFEQRLLEKLAAGIPDLTIVDTRQGIQLRPMSEHGSGDHAHSGGLDPHFWLDPGNVEIQARTICDALCDYDSENCAIYERNLAALTAQLDSLDRDISDMLQTAQGKSIYVFHPAFGYFADAYGIVQVAIEVEGKAPSMKQLIAATEQAKKDKVKALFVQPQFSAGEVQTMAALLGARVIRLDPLEQDYIRNMRTIAAEIRDALQPIPEAIDSTTSLWGK